ncbi:MAG: hypothetical protein ISR65_09095 [Bacteriovoracaceae bacterium]|nr:hypothetical protein [Bacteriovoracaceae bacterium]
MNSKFKEGDRVKLIHDVDICGKNTVFQNILPKGAVIKFEKNSEFDVADATFSNEVLIKNYYIETGIIILNIPEIKIGNDLLEKVE